MRRRSALPCRDMCLLKNATASQIIPFYEKLVGIAELEGQVCLDPSVFGLGVR